jgi:hypothetical protein
MAMTTSERLHKLVDELSDAEADATLQFVAAHGHGDVGTAEMLPLPAGWQTCPPGGRPSTGWPAWMQCAAGADARHRRERRGGGVRQG